MIILFAINYSFQEVNIFQAAILDSHSVPFTSVMFIVLDQSPLCWSVEIVKSTMIAVCIRKILEFAA